MYCVYFRNCLITSYLLRTRVRYNYHPMRSIHLRDRVLQMAYYFGYRGGGRQGYFLFRLSLAVLLFVQGFGITLLSEGVGRHFWTAWGVIFGRCEALFLDGVGRYYWLVWGVIIGRCGAFLLAGCGPVVACRVILGVVSAGPLMCCLRASF